MSVPAGLFDLRGRVAIVTGGAGLLGRRHCHALAEAGASVVVADIRPDEAEKVVESLGRGGDSPLYAVGVDVSKAASVEKMVHRVQNRFGKIDILINNAALTVKGGTDQARDYFLPFEEYPEVLWAQSLAVGLTGAYLCAQQVGRIMLKQQNGVIVNISSTYGIVGPDSRIYEGSQNPYDEGRGLNTPVAYSVVKSGIIGLTRYLAAHWRGKNIRVNTLTPGGVFDGHDDKFVENYSAKTILGRMAEVDEYKGALLFLSSDASSYMTGANLIVDGGWTAW